MSSDEIERICDNDGHELGLDDASDEIPTKDESQEVERTRHPPRLVEESNDEETNIISSDDLDEAIKQVLDDSLENMPISSAAYKSGNKAGRKVVAVKSKAARHPRARLAKAALQKSRAPNDGGQTTAIAGSVKSGLKKKAKAKKEPENESEGGDKKVEDDEATKKESEGGAGTGGEKSSSSPGSEGSTLEMKSEEDDAKKEEDKNAQTGPVAGHLGSVNPAQRVLVLCRRGDWYAVDQALKHAEKFEPGLQDEVRASSFVPSIPLLPHYFSQVAENT